MGHYSLLTHSLTDGRTHWAEVTRHFRSRCRHAHYLSSINHVGVTHLSLYTHTCITHTHTHSHWMVVGSPGHSRPAWMEAGKVACFRFGWARCWVARCWSGCCGGCFPPRPTRVRTEHCYLLRASSAIPLSRRSPALTVPPRSTDLPSKEGRRLHRCRCRCPPDRGNPARGDSTHWRRIEGGEE